MIYIYGSEMLKNAQNKENNWRRVNGCMLKRGKNAPVRREMIEVIMLLATPGRLFCMGKGGVVSE